MNATREQVLLGLLDSRGLRMGEEGIAMWLDAISDLTDEEAITAMRRFNREAPAKEFPSPNAVRKYAGCVGASDEDRAKIAWVAALQAVQNHGNYATVDFDDPLINATIRLMGGWRTFGDWPDDERKWKQREFVAMYETVSKTGAGDGSPLVGIFEAHNRSDGHLGHIPETQRIETGLTLHPIAKALTVTKQAAALNRSQSQRAVAAALPVLSEDR